MSFYAIVITKIILCYAAFSSSSVEIIAAMLVAGLFNPPDTFDAGALSELTIDPITSSLDGILETCTIPEYKFNLGINKQGTEIVKSVEDN